MEKNKVAIIGNFARRNMSYNGQTIKTRILLEEMRKQLPSFNIVELDTDGYRRHPFSLMFKVMYSLASCEHIIILLSRNGRRVLFPVLYHCNRVFKHHIWHNVIGAASFELIQKYPAWIKYMNSFDVNWVELSSLANKLRFAGINNVCVLPNFKKLRIVNKEEFPQYNNAPFRFCTFSRVEKMKGIEEAIKAITAVNEKYGSLICTLDIYGQIEKGQEEWFDLIKRNFPDFISYNGLVEYNKSVDVLKNYFMLLFPTKYRTEGFPGTIIDAFASGLPIIASMNCELIENEYTGWKYDGSDIEPLVQAIEKSILTPDVVYNMRSNCIEEANKFNPSTVVKQMIQEMHL